MKPGYWKLFLAVIFGIGVLGQYQAGRFGMMLFQLLLCFGFIAWFCYSQYKAKTAQAEEDEEQERLRTEADEDRARRKRIAELQEEKARLELEITRRQYDKKEYTYPTKPTEGHDRLFIKVAGVTFENEDGTDRQEILEDLESKIGGEITLNLQPDTYEGEPCIKVLADGQQVGYIPKRLVSYVMENFDRISELSDLVIVGGEDGLSYGLHFYINFQ